jgi:hypothetical protein
MNATVVENRKPGFSRAGAAVLQPCRVGKALTL